jgi:7-cyano-7-deazaguanine reductase
MQSLSMTASESSGRLRGEEEIANAALVPLPNPQDERPYLISFFYPEFTCKCPMTGYPDFASIKLWLLPEASIIELKSLKLYLNKFRDTYGFHEDVTNQILSDVVQTAEPVWARIEAHWNPRGNLTTVVTAEHNPARRPEELLSSPPASRSPL